MQQIYNTLVLPKYISMDNVLRHVNRREFIDLSLDTIVVNMQFLMARLEQNSHIPVTVCNGLYHFSVRGEIYQREI